MTGLPVSDHDHGVNGLLFGDQGELYILLGGNTNAGVEGGLSGSRLQKENELSAAVLVAHLQREDFNGSLVYDAKDDGNLLEGSGIEVFASGLRNPFDIVLHSQTGNLYATDNGPNFGYGKVSVSCEDEVEDIEEEDKLVLVKRTFSSGPLSRSLSLFSIHCRQWVLRPSKSKTWTTRPSAVPLAQLYRGQRLRVHCSAGNTSGFR